MSGEEVRLTPRAVETKKLAERIEQGTAYHEPVQVWFVDRTKHTVEVYALSEREFTDACKTAGTTIDVVVTAPEILQAKAAYDAARAKDLAKVKQERGEDIDPEAIPESPETLKAAHALFEAKQQYGPKAAQILESMDLALAVAEAATRQPGITSKLLGNNDAYTIAAKAFELMRPPKN
jgi:hypothetical protein